MVSLEQNDPHTVSELGNQEEFELNCVERLSNSVLLAHEIRKLLFCMNIINSDNHLAFFLIPLFLPHFLEPVFTEHLDHFAAALMDPG